MNIKGNLVIRIHLLLFFWHDDDDKKNYFNTKRKQALKNGCIIE